MSIFGKLFSKRTKQNNNAQPVPQPVAGSFSWSLPTLCGQDSTSFKNIDRLASELAMLNYGIYDAKTRQKVKRHKLDSVLHQPNLEDHWFNFAYQSVVDYYSSKGVFWLKSMYEGEVVSLFRLPGREVYVQRDPKTARRQFVYKGIVYTDDDVIYIPSRYGYRMAVGGMSIFDAASDSFKVAHSIDTFTQNAFNNGMAGQSVVIDVSKAMPNITKDQIEDVKNAFTEQHCGPGNGGKPIVKVNGYDYTVIGANQDNRAQELTENRKYQEHDINKLFQMPDDWSDIEKSFMLFNEFALKPLAVQFQEAINTMLDTDRYYFEFDFNGMMKVSLSARIDSYNKQIQGGWMSPDEARAKENLPPLPDGVGENFFMPVNLMPLNNETIDAYMAKQKAEVQQSQAPGEDGHSIIGDDK